MDSDPPPGDGPFPPPPPDHKDGRAAINEAIPLDHLWVKSRSVGGEAWEREKE